MFEHRADPHHRPAVEDSAAKGSTESTQGAPSLQTEYGHDVLSRRKANDGRANGKAPTVGLCTGAAWGEPLERAEAAGTASARV
jgi:hypothetical protein